MIRNKFSLPRKSMAAVAGARPNSFTVKALIDGKPWIKDFNQ